MKLSAAELDAALALVVQGGLSELLPPFLEVEAIAQSWQQIRPLLAAVDLRDYTIKPAMTLVGAKQRYVVRPIQLLDPLDTILYAGLARRLAPGIEAKRQPLSAERVFSYRFSADRESEFTLDEDYRGYKAQALQLCKEFDFVAEADIADFFPSIYVHRLSNAVDWMTKLSDETALLERWLMRWSPDTTPTSVGIPVGQLASNLLAEALLSEIDDYLARDHKFVRYVDDYLIFCRTRSDAFAALHALGERLLLVERLNLNMSKTGIKKSEVIAARLQGERSSLQEQQDEFIARFLNGNPYAQVEPEQVSEEMLEFIESVDAMALLGQALSTEQIDIQRLGFALQVLGATGDASGAPLLIENLPFLGAASRHVGRYLTALADYPGTDITEIAKALVTYIRNSDFKASYQVIWLLEPFAQSDAWNNHVDVLRIFKENTNTLVRRQALLAASQSDRRDVHLDVRLALSENQWLRRAALFGARRFRPDERKHIWPDFGDKDWTIENCLDRAVIRYAKKILGQEEAAAKAGGFDPDELPF